ncbi:MAG: hypothetical protein EP320_07310 [Rhodobacteraceae bacterium]|nr:MAG: hypothetical protein EP320_07310 [Paracoccaceae bacterium]
MKHLPAFSPDGGRDPYRDPELAEVLRAAAMLLWRNLWAMVLTGLVFAALGLVMAQRVDKLYRSSTQLMIERPVSSPIEVEQGGTGGIDAGYVEGQVLLLSSDDMLRKVVEQADLLEEPSFQTQPPSLLRQGINWVKSLVPAPAPSAPAASEEERRMISAVNTLSDLVSVDREGETNVVTIRASATSPRLAQRIAQTLAQSYITLRLDQREAEARGLSDWIDARASELRDKLSEAERAATAYRIENNLIGDAQGTGLGGQQLTELNAELIRSRADLAQKRASLEQAQQVLSGGGDPASLPEVQASPIIQALRETQMQLELRAEDAARIGREDNPRLSQIQRQIAAVEQQRRDEIGRIAQVLANETEALESRARLLSEALALAGGETGQESRDALKLRELERIVEAYRTRYERYLNNAGLASELQSFDTSGTQIVSAASLPLEPYYPPTKVFMILGFLGGVALVLIVALVRNALGRGFASIEEVENELGLRVLSALPLLSERQSGPDVIRREPFSDFSETVSVLRQSLMASAQEMRAGTGAPVVLITSAEDNVGKTTVAASLGEAASAAGKRVLVVDADLRFAGLTALYDMEDSPGLCEILRGQNWLPDIEPPEGGSLEVMPAGALRGRQPSGYFETPHLRTFLRAAAAEYDFVVVDGPPVANLADCRILARECSAVGVVMRVGRTSRDVMRAAIRQLPRQKLAGVIVTGVPPQDPAGRWSLGGGYTSSAIRAVSTEPRRVSPATASAIAKARKQEPA